MAEGHASTAHADTPHAAVDCSQGSLSKSEDVDQLHEVRDSIDRSLRLMDAGKREEAFAEAKTGYLQCFEAVEAPLDVVAGLEFRFKVENAFARVRGLIDGGAPTGEVRDRVVILRGADRRDRASPHDAGIGAPLLVFGQSFSLLLRGARGRVAGRVVRVPADDRARRSIGGPSVRRAGGGLATIAAYFAVDAIFAALPFGREVLEAVVGLFAVVVLFYVSFWLAARLEQRRWLEFLRARVWKAVSIGSATSLALIGFTSVFREGFETVLFYQAMLSFSAGLQAWVVMGVVAAAIVLAGVAWAVLKLGRVLPVRTFLSVAVIIVMATSVALVGNAMRALQEAAVIDVHSCPAGPAAHLPRPGHRLLPDTSQRARSDHPHGDLYVGGVYVRRRPRRRRRLELASA
jgi:high-affinity iron transporter